MSIKIYCNTNTFETLLKKSGLPVTTSHKEAGLLILGAKKIDFSWFTNLKAVYRLGVGSDNIDFDYLADKNVPVYFPGEKAKDILYDSAANFTVYAILHLLYQGAFGNIDNWEKKQRQYLGNKTALVVGLGNIGRRVKDKLKVFMPVFTYDVLYNQPSELKSMLKQADIITVHLPLTDETRHFFDKEKLSWIKDTALIINTARGALFEEDALFEKLKTSKCRAFFDVFWEEPYDGKLKSLGKDKFFMTPHSASNTEDFIQEALADILRLAKELEG